MISTSRLEEAYTALRSAGFTSPETRELLAGPKGLRDEFAGQAMASTMGRAVDPNEVVRFAYIVADAMMIERAK